MIKDNKIPQSAQKLIGERLKEIRREKGYSNYEQFCFIFGFTRSKYSKYENGGNMRLDTLLKLLRALDISIIDFFSPINDQLYEQLKNDPDK